MLAPVELGKSHALPGFSVLISQRIFLTANGPYQLSKPTTGLSSAKVGQGLPSLNHGLPPPTYTTRHNELSSAAQRVYRVPCVMCRSIGRLLFLFSKRRCVPDGGLVAGGSRWVQARQASPYQSWVLVRHRS